jgi:hypothetical protein
VVLILSPTKAMTIDVSGYWIGSKNLPAVSRLFAVAIKVSALVDRYRSGQNLSRAEWDALGQLESKWRERLSDISWFMRCLNESVARRANQEDRCSGRFWEGRFKSQALLDEKALAACLAYVDLNPVRAKMAQTPESSEYTSIAERIAAAKNSGEGNQTQKDADQPAHLLSFVGNPRKEMPKGLPFKLTDYLELVDWTGRILREDKRGYIAQEIPPILERLQIDPRIQLASATGGFISKNT